MVTVHSDRVVGFMLGLLSSLAYGAADFAGGLAARRARVTQVVALAAPASLPVELVAWTLLGASWSASAIWWAPVRGCSPWSRA